MKIFIIHARRTGYGVVRSFVGQDNTSIFVADTIKTPVFYSKYICGSFLVSDITKVSEDVFLKEIITLAELMNYQDEKPIVYTGKDDYLIFFSKNYDKLSKYFYLSFESDFNKLNRALSKFELIDVANNADVLIPLSFTSKDSITRIFSSISYPVIIKPAIKNKPEIDVVSAAFRIRKCENQVELEKAINLLQSLGVDYVVQEYISGSDDDLYTIGTYSYRGELKAWSTSKKLRQFPPQTGECSLGKTFYSNNLVEPAKKLLKEIELTGISQIEFKKHNGHFYLIEINPRIWSWHQIHQKVGVNLCLIAANYSQLNFFISKTIEPFKGKKGEKKWIFFTMDYLHNFLLHRNVSLFALIRDFICCDLEAFFNLRDPAPFLKHIKETSIYIKRQKKLNKTINKTL